MPLTVEVALANVVKVYVSVGVAVGVSPDEMPWLGLEDTDRVNVALALPLIITLGLNDCDGVDMADGVDVEV